MGFPPAWIAELSQIPRKTVDDIIRGNGPWSQMPRNELYDRTREQLKVLNEQIAYSSATKARFSRVTDMSYTMARHFS